MEVAARLSSLEPEGALDARDEDPVAQRAIRLGLIMARLADELAPKLSDVGVAALEQVVLDLLGPT